MHNEFSNCLNAKYLERISELKYRREGVHPVDKILGLRAVELVKNMVVLSLKNFLPLRKNVTEYWQFH